MVGHPRAIAFVPAYPGDRGRDIALMLGLILWLVYTRVFWVLQAAHMTLPPCPFYTLTGHPCPFCGGTRSFAYMWHGDVANAVRLYPLGPAIFAGTFAAIGVLGYGIVSGKTLNYLPTPRQWRLLVVVAASVLAVSWALKIFVLGN
jgi:hypothetical protein